MSEIEDLKEELKEKIDEAPLVMGENEARKAYKKALEIIAGKES